jgi:mannosylglycoprotein endo-beta-mannosidase
MTRNSLYRILPTLLFFHVLSLCLNAQQRLDLQGNWKCQNVLQTHANGTKISDPGFQLVGWQPTVVPGTVLTTLVANGEMPDPFFGMNNEQIPDVYHTGPEHYTYWFVKDFDYSVQKGEEVWLHLRGVNYSSDVYLNGHKVNAELHKGMFLRQTYNVTSLLRTRQPNRVAVIVFPPDPPGNPNGGQGGDGTIGRNVGHQYVAGWDWIQPIRDRNTGIWDKVWLEKTMPVNLKNPHIITKVRGKRQPGGDQAPAIVHASVELENPTNSSISGTLNVRIDGVETKLTLELPAKSDQQYQLPPLRIDNPKLWWPNGYGEQALYTAELEFVIKGQVSDREVIEVGIREVAHGWNDRTRSMQFYVNGQRIFIKGGNWIISDAMLRFSRQRYDAEIRFHRDMNLNLIRIWGGAITERPEFYEACDKYGLLVMQDFWMSGDCNGRWLDPKKLEDQWVRRGYPDDHDLFIHSASDMIKMIRNHPSLAVWCGGNEITPPENILTALTDSIIPALDGTRKFITYSNSDSMSYNFIGGNGDGPYTIQPIERFWQERTFPFNSEVGSVGIGDLRSLERFIPVSNLLIPQQSSALDSVWRYHKFMGYGKQMEPYGTPSNLDEYAEIAQLLNYNQYRALAEGFTAHKWDWYTGYIIWKTQNPWTALRGQMYDYYLDPNAGLYGLHSGNEPIHVMCNPVDGMVMAVNHRFSAQRDLMLRVEAFDMQGKRSLITQVFVYIKAQSAKNILSVQRAIEKIGKEHGCFIRLQLLKSEDDVVSENLYWLPNESGEFTGLRSYQQPDTQVMCRRQDNGMVEISIENSEGGNIAFFNRISLVSTKTKKRVLPVFFSDNYISIAPGEKKVVTLDPVTQFGSDHMISLRPWNAPVQYFSIK